nr:hypothetical protein [Streptococcus agalactiae]
MATNLGQAYVQIMPSAKGISGSISKTLDPEASSAGSSAGSLLGGKLIGILGSVIAAAKIGEMVTKAISSSISEGAALQQSLGGVETLFKSNANLVKNMQTKPIKQLAYQRMRIWKVSLALVLVCFSRSEGIRPKRQKSQIWL